MYEDEDIKKRVEENLALCNRVLRIFDSDDEQDDKETTYKGGEFMGEKKFGKDTRVRDYIITEIRDEVLKLIESRLKKYDSGCTVNVAVMRYILKKCIKRLDYLPLK